MRGRRGSCSGYHIAVDTFADGPPLYRQVERFARIGLELDRGTMSRWLEDLGATLIEAMWIDRIVITGRPCTLP